MDSNAEKVSEKEKKGNSGARKWQYEQFAIHRIWAIEEMLDEHFV